jgi:hypothetical protein
MGIHISSKERRIKINDRSPYRPNFNPSAPPIHNTNRPTNDQQNISLDSVDELTVFHINYSKLINGPPSEHVD